MPTYHVSIEIHASPAAVFNYIADLTKHGEWTADPVQIEAVAAGPIAVGKEYRSAAQVKGQTIRATLRVTTYTPPTHFGFAVRDVTGAYDHLFSCTASGAGTRLERQITGHLSVGQTIFFWLVYPFVKRPNARKALQKLKARLEHGSS